MKRFLGFILFVSISTLSYAKEFKVADIQLDIPAGFQGPHHNSAQGMSILAFVHKHANKDAGTLLQITVWDPGMTFPEMSKEQLQQGATQYLQQMVSSLPQDKSNFQQGELEYTTIAGIPAARTYWEGEFNLNKQKAHGFAYAFIANSKIYFLNTHDLTEFQGQYIKQALDSFQTIQLINQ